MASSLVQSGIQVARVAANLGATATGAAAVLFATQSLTQVATNAYRYVIGKWNNTAISYDNVKSDKKAKNLEKALHYTFRGPSNLSYKEKGVIALGLFGISLVLNRLSANPTGLVGKVVSYLPVLANKSNPILNSIPRI